MRKRRLLMGFVVGLAVGLLFTPVLARPALDESSIAERFGLPEAWNRVFFEPLGSAMRQIHDKYVEEVKPDEMLVGAYYGILSKLDEYSTYIPPDMLQEFEADTVMGEFGGLGILIHFYPVDRILGVERTIPGTPAFRAGVLAGDTITKIYEVSTDTEVDTSTLKDVHDAVRLLRGEPGTKVRITVRHKDSLEEEDITIERAVIQVPGVRDAHIINDKWKIGYVYVASFHDRMVGDLETALRGLKEQGMRALVLDLRFNSGGLLKAAVELSSKFLDDGVVVSVQGRATPREAYRASEGDLLNGAPLVVLVNRYSASAAEIVAGAIKDNKRGIVVGETTYGKGSVQTIVYLEDEVSAIKFTTARYFTPSGESIEKAGVKPDVEIKLSNEDVRRLANALYEAVEYPPKPEVKPEEKGTEALPPEGGKEPVKEEKEPFRDVQLERAVDILIGMCAQQDRST